MRPGGIFLFQLVILGSFGLASCAKYRSLPGYRALSPQSATDTGIVVRYTKEDASKKIEQLLANNSEAQVRVINAPQGLYEVFNMKEEDVQSNFGVESTFANFYAEKLIPSARKLDVDLSTCKTGAQSPTANITVKSLQDKLTGDKHLIELGDGPVVLSSDGSTNDGWSNQLQWLVRGPEGSDLAQFTSTDSQITLNPSQPGDYQVLLVVRDASSFCGGQFFEFGVTYNEPYKGPVAARPFDPSIDSVRFNHLAEIHAQDAWQVAKGDGVVIAVVDTGVNYNHPDLSANIYVNKGEIPNNGIDDDKNGFVDDVVGWDFSNNDSMPIDDNMHGTHVAGLAASAVSGVAPHAKILPVKVLGASGGGDTGTILGGIYYAVDRGANIINLSLGMDGLALNAANRKKTVDAFKAAVDYANSKGAIVVVAAGNGDQQGVGFDIDTHPMYPASIPGENVVAVSALTDGQLSSYSNYGVNTVTLAAPGGDMKLDNNGSVVSKLLMAPYYWPSKAMYVGLAGTSMATPVTAGALALVKSVYGQLSNSDLIKTLASTGTALASLSGKVKSGAEINVLTAVHSAKQSAQP